MKNKPQTLLCILWLCLLCACTASQTEIEPTTIPIQGTPIPFTVLYEEEVGYDIIVADDVLEYLSHPAILLVMESIEDTSAYFSIKDQAQEQLESIDYTQYNAVIVVRLAPAMRHRVTVEEIRTQGNIISLYADFWETSLFQETVLTDPYQILQIPKSLGTVYQLVVDGRILAAYPQGSVALAPTYTPWAPNPNIPTPTSLPTLDLSDFQQGGE